MHIQEQYSGVSRERRKRSTREGTEPNIKRIIPGTDIQQGDGDRKIRTTLIYLFLLLFFFCFFIPFVIEFMMCYSMSCIVAEAV